MHGARLREGMVTVNTASRRSLQQNETSALSMLLGWCMSQGWPRNEQHL